MAHFHRRRNAIILSSLAALAAMAVANRLLAKKAERRDPPLGKFITAAGSKLHYIERGTGTPVILLHGNGMMLQDFLASGLVDRLAESYRVIAFDRPGFGYSERPSDRDWGPDSQADVIQSALRSLGVESAIVLGHSWGTLVAVALAAKNPEMVKALVLVSGYYFPVARLDTALASVAATPLLGTILCYTVAPMMKRLLWPLTTRKLFGPRSIPQKFSAFPRELAVRPAQTKTVAEEAAFMNLAANSLRDAYSGLKMPVVIVAGADDRVVDPAQSEALALEIHHSLLKTLPGQGHMVHQTSTPEILSVIYTAEEESARLSLPVTQPEAGRMSTSHVSLHGVHGAVATESVILAPR